MELRNTTSFNASLLHGSLAFSRHATAVVVKGTFRILGSARVEVAPKQLDLAELDQVRTLRGKDLAVYESDFCLYKPYADILVWSPDALGGPTVRIGEFVRRFSDAGELLPHPRSSSHRRGLAGTYDAEWLRTRWPALPEDFDWRYSNCACPELQLPFLSGDERMELYNLHPGREFTTFQLPGLRICAFLPPLQRGGASIEIPMNLDTLWIDLETGRVVLVWRGLIVKHRFPLFRHRCVVLSACGIGETTDVSVQDVAIGEPEEARFLGESETASDEDEDAASGVPLPEEPMPPDIEDVLRIATETGSLAGMILDNLDLSGRSLRGVSLKDASLRGASLERADLAKATLVTADMAGANLTRANLAGADLTDADLSGVVAVASDFSGAALTAADLSSTNLAEARLDNCSAEGVDLSGAILSGASVRDAVLRDVMLTEAALDDADFSGADLSDATLDGAWGPRACFDRATLEGIGADDDCRLEGAQFRQARASGANWLGCHLSGADFTLADLTGADFSNGVLSGARLRGACLAHASFSGSMLTSADFTGSDLREARFDRALLLETTLSECNLYHADLVEARIEGAHFDGALTHGVVLREVEDG